MAKHTTVGINLNTHTASGEKRDVVEPAPRNSGLANIYADRNKPSKPRRSWRPKGNRIASDEVRAHRVTRLILGGGMFYSKK